MPKITKQSTPKEVLYTFDQVKEVVNQQVQYARGELELKHKQEIEKLEALCAMWRRLYEAALPKKRGRPKKTYMPVDGPLSLLFGEVLLPNNAGKKNGRPKIHKNPNYSIEQWEIARKWIAEKIGKKWVGDKEAIKEILEGHEDWHSLSRAKKSELKAMFKSSIKQWRDSTGVRIHKRRKQKIP